MKNWSTMKKLMLLRGVSASSAIEDVATGNPVVFQTDLSKALKRLAVSMLPVQSGSGDPSPQNIRPIVAWDGVTVWNGGKNLFDANSYPITQNRIIWPGDGTSDVIDGFAATMDYIPCAHIAGKTVTLNKRPGGGNPGFAFYTAKNTGSRFAGISNMGIAAGTPWSFQIPEGAKYMRFTVPAGATDIQIEAGSTATAYEPYQPITETDIPFPSPVYGGTLDVVSGVMTVEYGILIKNTASMNGYSEDMAGWVEGAGIKALVGEGVNSSTYDVICDKAKGVTINTVSWRDNIYLPERLNGLTQTEWKAFATDVMFVARLATPVEIQLTPEQITALLGNNTVWSDADGDIDVTFLRKG